MFPRHYYYYYYYYYFSQHHELRRAVPHKDLMMWARGEGNGGKGIFYSSCGGGGVCKRVDRRAERDIKLYIHTFFKSSQGGLARFGMQSWWGIDSGALFVKRCRERIFDNRFWRQ
jgi:hypothetical protein